MGTMHEICQLMFVVGNDILGIREIDVGEEAQLGYRRGGVVFVCRHCGQPWAWIILNDSKGHQTSFAEIADVACERHPDQWNVSGSLLGGYRNWAYQRLLPPLALKREFILHHNKFFNHPHGRPA
jgi:hypothetical protein